MAVKWLSVIGLCMLAMAIGNLTSAKQASPLGYVTVAALELSRRATPTRVQMPSQLWGRVLWLRSGTERTPMQVDERGVGYFLLKRLPARATTIFAVEEAASVRTPPRASVRTDANGVWLGVDGRDVLQYRTSPKVPRADIDAVYGRGGYLHPLKTPKGVVVTDDYPRDHLHHHGVWTAFTSTRFRGRTPDFWNMGKKLGRKDHEQLLGQTEGPVVAILSARLSSTDLTGAAPTRVLDEHWRVTQWALDVQSSDYHLFDLKWSEQLVGGDPLLLPEHRYGGLGVRGRGDWLLPGAARFLTSSGRSRLDGDDTRGRWCYLGGPVPPDTQRVVPGAQAGVAVLVHPNNVAFPQPLRLHPKEPYFSVAPMKVGALSIEKDRPLVSRYRFVVLDGPPDPDVLERLWQDYATPPRAVFSAGSPTTPR